MLDLLLRFDKELAALDDAGSVVPKGLMNLGDDRRELARRRFGFLTHRTYSRPLTIGFSAGVFVGSGFERDYLRHCRLTVA